MILMVNTLTTHKHFAILQKMSEKKQKYIIAYLEQRNNDSDPHFYASIMLNGDLIEVVHFTSSSVVSVIIKKIYNYFYDCALRSARHTGIVTHSIF